MDGMVLEGLFKDLAGSSSPWPEIEGSVIFVRVSPLRYHFVELSLCQRSLRTSYHAATNCLQLALVLLAKCGSVTRS